MLLFLQLDPTSSHDVLFRRFNLRGPPAFRLEMKQQNTQEEKIPIQAMATLKIIKKHHTRRHRPYDLPTWGQIKTLTNQTKNLISQECLRILKIFFFAMLALLAFASPAQADLIDHIYWAYIPNPPFVGCKIDRHKTNHIH